jgi:hypothetical protein
VNFLVWDEQGAERLVLRAGADSALTPAISPRRGRLADGQVGEKSVDLGRARFPREAFLRKDGATGGAAAGAAGARFPRVAFLRKEDKALDPIDVGILGADAVVADTAGRADLVQQSRWAWVRSRWRDRLQSRLGVHEVSSCWGEVYAAGKALSSKTMADGRLQSATREARERGSREARGRPDRPAHRRAKMEVTPCAVVRRASAATRQKKQPQCDTQHTRPVEVKTHHEAPHASAS